MTQDDCRKLARKAIISAIKHQAAGRINRMLESLMFAQAMLGDREAGEWSVKEAEREREDVHVR